MANYLPEAIVLNILQRLSLKTLLRCTSVCKSWYSLITSPEFTYLHLNFTADSRNTTPNFLSLRRCIRNSQLYDVYSESESFARETTLEFSFRSINSFFTVVGSCNGLLCLSDDRVYYVHTIILWNPCVKRSIVLPKPNLIYNSYGTFVQSLGFGFDPVSRDYKVFRITYVDCARQHPQVELYKLSTGVWQDLSHLALDYVIYNKSRQAYVNRAIHWIACCKNCYDLIVLFDMYYEVFRSMKLPVGLLNNDNPTNKDLVVYKESLALISWNVSGAEPSFCLWMMKEYGVEETWSKHFSFDSHVFCGGFMSPLWVGRRGEVIVVRQDGRLVSYDHDGVVVKDLGVHDSSYEDCRRSIHVDSYKESLVLLEGAHCFSDAVTCYDLPNLHTNNSDFVDIYGCDYELCFENDCK
ncbi:hypothetical protein CDL12_08233 [Handroanthus impetiginosus]|uniref:F-box domain-containing protein n=1 Tax=Handroanthus impetiginosus TaxID=429701 RepID=A0A2G9HNH5_9LAMI|nr:hypothetical protein CDL12_08233 [Handroanthus impetiginosus]